MEKIRLLNLEDGWIDSKVHFITFQIFSMNQLSKSIFLSGYTILALLGAVIGVDQFIHGYTFAALGLFMTALPFVFFISALFLFDIARTSANLSIGSWVVTIGVFVLGYAFYIKSAESMAAVGFLLALCWFLYIKWWCLELQ